LHVCEAGRIGEGGASKEGELGSELNVNTSSGILELERDITGRSGSACVGGGPVVGGST